MIYYVNQKSINHNLKCQCYILVNLNRVRWIMTKYSIDFETHIMKNFYIFMLTLGIVIALIHYLNVWLKMGNVWET